jgi:Na+-driven multidrug efflux pump
MIFDVAGTEHFHMMDWWYNLFGPFWWIFMALGMIIYIVTGIIIGYKVHKDAIRRNIANSEVWLIIALIFNVVGLFLYLLVRSNYIQDREVSESK